MSSTEEFSIAFRFVRGRALAGPLRRILQTADERRCTQMDAHDNKTATMICLKDHNRSLLHLRASAIRSMRNRCHVHELLLCVRALCLLQRYTRTSRGQVPTESGACQSGPLFYLRSHVFNLDYRKMSRRYSGGARERTLEEVAEAEDLRLVISAALRATPVDEQALRRGVWTYVSSELSVGTFHDAVLRRLSTIGAASIAPGPAREVLTRRVLQWSVEAYFGHLGGEPYSGIGRVTAERCPA